MSQEYIEVKGARVNNLKNIDVRLPLNRLTVITGVSGSGKSSLAFDTLYAEGQRRYVESLSSYARQFLGRKNKPECDFIRGIPPAIAIEQKVTSRNPRSTVGTSTEIYEYLRLLFSRIGHTFSPISGKEVKKHTIEDVVRKVGEFSEGTRFLIMAPMQLRQGRTVEQQLQACLQEGFSRIVVDGTNEVVRIEDYLSLPEEQRSTLHNIIYIVVDRMQAGTSKDNISRIVDSAETAFYEGNGSMRLMFMPAALIYDFSTRFEADGITFSEPDDQLFSFNSPMGACQECQGFGQIIGIDEHLVVPDTSLSVYDGCVVCWHGEKMSEWKNWFCQHAVKDDFPIFKPYYSLSAKQKDWLWHGLPSDKGRAEKPCIDSFFEMVKANQYKIQYRVMMSRYRGKTICPHCHGTRLKEQATYVKIAGKSITDLVEMPVDRLYQWFADLQLNQHEKSIAQRLLSEITARLRFLLDVGLGYLTLNRSSNTLSGGESQRISLCTSLGSSLVGSLYILDEPSIGLHPRDTDKLISVLHHLRDIGNTVVVVEHDDNIIRAADHLIDIGPLAGTHGGEVVYNGPLADINDTTAEKFPNSQTIKYLTGQELVAPPKDSRPSTQHITIRGARMHNLKGIDVDIPLNVLTVVTGVSGSGKSSLIKGILYPALRRRLGDVADPPGEFSGLSGDLMALKRVEMVDQNPIGKSTRSNPATYVKAFDAIRDLFAEQPLAKQMGFTSQYFSFNADGGRCDECKGAGTITVEMQFMADLVLECESCHGHRFKSDILDVRYEGKNIDEVLNMTISEAIDFFQTHNQKVIVQRLKPLQAVGLGYIKLGQSSSTLSGGENQRVKLAYFIGLERQDPTMFIFDEPTTGLHYKDISMLLEAFTTLIRHGHTIVVIEHNMEVIKHADHVIDLGPEGGNGGGNLVVCGTPREVAACKQSHTGQFLKDYQPQKNSFFLTTKAKK